MEKNVLPKFDCFSNPATIGSRWKRWLTSFELYADGKGLLISEGTTAATYRGEEQCYSTWLGLMYRRYLPP